MSWFDRKPPVEMVPKSEHTLLARERDALKEKVAGLQAQAADLTGKYTALGFDYALLEGVAKKALALLLEVDTSRSGGIALFRKRTDLLKEAGAAGLLEEKQEEQSS